MSDHQSHYANQEKLVAALRDPRRYPHAVKAVQVIETHISWVLLAGRFAYKVKKALDLGFLDYSELDARRAFCSDEIRLNRRTAPEIYLDVASIGGSPDDPVFGAEPAVEYAVRMHRFPSARLMDRLLMQGRVTARHIDSLAATIAIFHSGIPTADAGSAFGTAASIYAAALLNFEQLRGCVTDDVFRERIAKLQADTEAEYAACKATFDARREQGFVRECHGDLHLGNIVLLGDQPVLFDCIEFNAALRWIDVMDEIAFAVMDLLHRDHPDFAWRLLNACLADSGDYAGMAVMRFYLAYRATVRAKVCAIRASQPDISARAKSAELAACDSYLALAQRSLERKRPGLIITHGLPGSGKTTFSQLVLEQKGFVRLRSDVERKRIFGLGMLESSRARAGNIYGTEATRRTYARLHDLAGALLAAGYSVIVDAAFLKQDERETFRSLAREMSVPFAIASLHAPDVVLRERLSQRRDDASEADVAVLDLLRAAQQPLSADELAVTAEFTTAQAPGSGFNTQGWDKLNALLASA